MAVGSDGYRATLVRRQLMPGLISSSPGMAGLPPFTSFSTSYPELDFSVRRSHPVQHHHDIHGRQIKNGRKKQAARHIVGLAKSEL